MTAIGDRQLGNCFPFEDALLYQPDEQHLVLFDRGYFFELSPSANTDVLWPNYVTQLQGVPGNNRAEWQVHFKQQSIHDLDGALAFFKEAFPYGGKDVLAQWTSTTSYQDKAHLIEYQPTKNGLHIVKHDPAGTIHIDLQVVKGVLTGSYRFELPDY